MPKAILTSSYVDKIRPPSRRAKARYHCTKTQGLMVEVRSTGIKTIYANVHLPDGRRRQIKIGRFGEVTMETARKKTAELRGQAAEGIDPADERNKAREVPLFREFGDTYIEYAKTAKKNLGR